ncbi:MAG TPA: MerR family transcriptional regulator [Micromonosporaceae bacterium]
MRISDLSQSSGLPIATIKYYLREGLLPPGTRTARNQAEYDQTHLVRLRLIRILTTVGQLTVSSVRQVLIELDERGQTPRRLRQVVNRALYAQLPETLEMGQPERDAQAKVNSLLAQLGWRPEADSAGRDTLAAVFATLPELGWDVDLELFARYGQAAHDLVTHELDAPTAESTAGTGREPDAAATVVARAVLFEVALAAMRRMAHEQLAGESASRVGPGRPSGRG